MTPRIQEGLKTIGGLVVTLCLGMYVWQGLPFLMVDPASGELETGSAVVVAKQAESLSGATNRTAVTCYVRFATADGRTGQGEVSSQQFDAWAVEDSVAVVFWGRRCLLKEDVRWDPPSHRRYWFMLTATAVFGLITLRRIFKRGTQ